MANFSQDGGNRFFGLEKDPALRRAKRLAAVADSVGSLDVQAIAAAYQKESGMSSIEAAGAAAAAMNAALKSGLVGGSSSEAREAAERQVRDVARRRAKEARGEAWRAAQADEEGEIGEIRRDVVRHELEARNSRAAESKSARLADDTAAKKAMREERLAAAAGRRALSEARARFGAHKTRAWRPPDESDAESDSFLGGQPLVIDDPALRRAKALCSGAARVIEQLEAQDQMLKSAAFGKGRPLPPVAKPNKATEAQLSRFEPQHEDRSSRFQSAHASAVDAEEAQLLARAKELLADYKPAGGRKQSVAASSAAGSPKQESRQRKEASVTMAIQRGRARAAV